MKLARQPPPAGAGGLARYFVKPAEVPLPETGTAPDLRTEFGDVTTLLLAVTIGPVSEADGAAKLRWIR